VINDIREFVAARPFVPFTIHLVDGGAVRVPTVDHVYVTATGNRVIVSFDDGTYDVIRPLMISRVTLDREATSSET
jgi:hypothetical protein